MRIAAYELAGAQRLGLLDSHAGRHVIRPLPAGLAVLDLLAADKPGRRAAEAAATAPPVRLSEVRLLPPLQPPSLRDFVSFEAHVEGVTRVMEGRDGVPDAWYEQPTFLFMNPHSVIGAHDQVPVPAGCTLLDYELEVAAVIGRDGRNLTPAQAAEQRMGLGPAKGKDFASTLGPCIVTADELAPYQQDDRLDLEMTVLVNSAEMGRDRLANMA